MTAFGTTERLSTAPDTMGYIPGAMGTRAASYWTRCVEIEGQEAIRMSRSRLESLRAIQLGTKGDGWHNEWCTPQLKTSQNGSACYREGMSAWTMQVHKKMTHLGHPHHLLNTPGCSLTISTHRVNKDKSNRNLERSEEWKRRSQLTESYDHIEAKSGTSSALEMPHMKSRCWGSLSWQDTSTARHCRGRGY